MIIGEIGAQGARGFVVEFAGTAISALSVEARFTLCNMAVEAGARGALIAPDQTAIDYVLAKCPDIVGTTRDAALAAWQHLHSDEGAAFDVEHRFDASTVEPHVTWGTSPDQVLPITGLIPDASKVAQDKKRSTEQALTYAKLQSGEPLVGTPI
jgi:3-isopropylmalate/(R)-2-methylmalate dehydratase large subunit